MDLMQLSSFDDNCMLNRTSKVHRHTDCASLKMAQQDYQTPVPQAKYCIVSFPTPNILLVRLNRPKDLNCINSDGHAELDALWNWLDAEPKLCCGIITGTGRAFSAGADLKGRFYG